ncbi:hypothetical protein QIW31_08900 [Francisellaceae bacterium CB299]|jgi:hypothetical protein
MYHNFIGIDIAQKDFVVSIHRKKKTSTHLNNHTGFDELLNAYPLIKQYTLVVLETT